MSGLVNTIKEALTDIADFEERTAGGAGNLTGDALAALETLRVDLTESHARIEAAKKRIGDLKAIHSRWRDGQDPRRLPEIIDEMETVAYSIRMYLDGVPGLYRPAAEETIEAVISKITARSIEIIAGEVAARVFYHISDATRQSELRTLLIEFADEIKRSAIEP